MSGLESVTERWLGRGIRVALRVPCEFHTPVSPPNGGDAMIGRETRVLLRHYLEQGMDKAAVARQLGISERTVYHWITAGRLARTFVVSLVESLEPSLTPLVGQSIVACSLYGSHQRRHGRTDAVPVAWPHADIRIVDIGRQACQRPFNCHHFPYHRHRLRILDHHPFGPVSRRIPKPVLVTDGGVDRIIPRSPSSGSRPSESPLYSIRTLRAGNSIPMEPIPSISCPRS